MATKKRTLARLGARVSIFSVDLPTVNFFKGFGFSIQLLGCGFPGYRPGIHKILDQFLQVIGFIISWFFHQLFEFFNSWRRLRVHRIRSVLVF